MTDKTRGSTISAMHELIMNYPYRIWILSIFITPAFNIVYDAIVHDGSSPLSISGIIWYMLILAGIFIISVPAMATHIFLFTKLVNSGLSSFLIKLLLFLTAIMVLLITVWLLGERFLVTTLVFNKSYETTWHHIVVIGILSFAFRLKNPGKQ